MALPIYFRRFRTDKKGASVGEIDMDGGRGNPKKEKLKQSITSIGISLLYIGFVFQILDLLKN